MLFICQHFNHYQLTIAIILPNQIGEHQEKPNIKRKIFHPIKYYISKNILCISDGKYIFVINLNVSEKNIDIPILETLDLTFLARKCKILVVVIINHF